ncbi:MAG: alginate lyase family protein [Pseudomonadota bacterium]
MPGSPQSRRTRPNRRVRPGLAAALALALPMLAVFAPVSAAAASSCSELVGNDLFVWRAENLNGAAAAIERADPAVLPAYRQLIEDADAALHRGPYTVTDKTRAPPSGDLKDYTSLAPYWWQDPDAPEGLPYIRRDGEVNPERNGDNFDRIRLRSMARDVQALALAAYLGDDDAYANHASLLLRVWFVNAPTRMNPSLDFAQSIPGRTEGRGIGIIDTAELIAVVDAIRLLALNGMLEANTYISLREWFAAYARWLITDQLGLDERNARNNHGTFYDLQLMLYSMFAGDCKLARRILDDTRVRIDMQIEGDGSMPLEEARTRSLHYTIYNLRAFLQIARLAEHLDIDLYRYRGRDDEGSIVATLRLLAGYAGRESSWPHRQIGRASDRELWMLLRLAATAIDDPALTAALFRASGRSESDRSVLLTFTP